MRIRIGIILAYLLLGCILLEDALPYLGHANLMEIYEAKTESGEKDSKKEIEDEWKELNDKLPSVKFFEPVFLMHGGSISANSDIIPDSAHQSIFSPPPDRV